VRWLRRISTNISRGMNTNLLTLSVSHENHCGGRIYETTRTMAAARIYENHGGGAARRNHIPWIEGGHVAWLTGCGAEDQRNSRGSSSVFLWKVCPSLHLPHIIFAVFYVQCAESADTHLRTWLQSSHAQPQLCQD
jgi:hypothetical protein